MTTKTTPTKRPEKFDRAIHSDNTTGKIVEVSSGNGQTMVLVFWDDGETDTYDASRLYFIKRTGTWLVQD